MKIQDSRAVVMYRDPIDRWMWESGVAYWVIGIFLAIMLLYVLASLPGIYRRKR